MIPACLDSPAGAENKWRVGEEEEEWMVGRGDKARDDIPLMVSQLYPPRSLILLSALFPSKFLRSRERRFLRGEVLCFSSYLCTERSKSCSLSLLLGDSRILFYIDRTWCSNWLRVENQRDTYDIYIVIFSLWIFIYKKSSFEIFMNMQTMLTMVEKSRSGVLHF